MHFEPFACPRCHYLIHGDPGACFATCPECRGRLVCWPERGWQLLTQAELDRLELIDLRWHKEKDNYRVWDRMGSRIPSIVGSILALVAAVASGAVLIWWDRANLPPAEREQRTMIGTLFIVLGGGFCLCSLAKAQQYRDAHAAYQQRRLQAIVQGSDTYSSPERLQL
jgi:hypothetical protein